MLPVTGPVSFEVFSNLTALQELHVVYPYAAEIIVCDSLTYQAQVLQSAIVAGNTATVS